MMRAAVGKNKTCRCLQLLCGVVVFPVLLSLLLGCGGRPTVVLFMEAYWEEFFNASREELRELVKSHGFQQKIVAIHTLSVYDLNME